jgi:hypothetical protein
MQWFSYNQRALELSELTSQNRYDNLLKKFSFKEKKTQKEEIYSQ